MAELRKFGVCLFLAALVGAAKSHWTDRGPVGNQ